MRSLTIALFLSLCAFVIEISFGYLSKSLALTTDSLHVFVDFAIVLATYIAYSMSTNKPTKSYTYGYHRVEPLVTFIGMLLLLGMLIYVDFAAFNNFFTKSAIVIALAIPAAIIGLLINLTASWTLDREKGFLVKSAKVHYLSDSINSIVVIIALSSYFLTGNSLFDPLGSIVISLLILRMSLPIIKSSLYSIIDKSPIPVEDVKKKLIKVSGVSEVHDIHIWEPCPDYRVATLHIIPEKNSSMKNMDKIRINSENEMKEFKIQHSTIQFELLNCHQLHQHGF